MKGKTELQKILGETLALVSLPDNDFAWSSWAGPEEAIAELARYQLEIDHDDFSHINRLEIIFGPTGPLQEVSISSGWDQIFLDLSEKYDRAIALLLE